VTNLSVFVIKLDPQSITSCYLSSHIFPLFKILPLSVSKHFPFVSQVFYALTITQWMSILASLSISLYWHMLSALTVSICLLGFHSTEDFCSLLFVILFSL